MSPITTRLLTPRQYGTVGLLATLWGMITWAQYAGMDHAYPFFRARDEDGTSSQPILVTATVVATVASLAFCGLLLLVGLGTPLLTRYAEVGASDLRLFLLGLIPLGLANWYLYVLRFMHHAAAFARVSTVARVLGTLAALPLMARVAQPDRLSVFFAVTAASQWAALTLAFIELRRLNIHPYRREDLSRPLARRMLSYGVVLVPASVAYSITFFLDRFMVGWLAGVEEASKLSLAFYIGAVALMLRAWFSLVWSPHVVDWIASSKPELYLRRFELTSHLLAAIFFIGAAVVDVWADVAIHTLYPPFYLAASSLVAPIVLAGAFSMQSLVAATAAMVADTPRYHLPIYGVALTLNAAVCLLGIPRYGAYAAVVGSVMSEAAIVVGWVVLERLRLRNLPIRWTRQALLAGAATVFVFAHSPPEDIGSAHSLVIRGFTTVLLVGLFLTLLRWWRPANGWRSTWT